MSSVFSPDASQVGQWLERAGYEHYVCEHCHGLHLADIQSRDGVLDSRLFVEPEGLLLSTELELRPSALLMVQADLTRLNMIMPGLKVFIDINDETVPRLVACDLLMSGAGVSFEQFQHFLQVTLAATGELLEDCRQTACLYEGEPGDEPSPTPGPSLH